MTEEITQEQFRDLVSKGVGRARERIKPPKGYQGPNDTERRYGLFLASLRQDASVPSDFVTEYPVFQELGRKHRADIAWPADRLAVEIDGGVYSRRAHGSITGILTGMQKQNLYASIRWHCLRVTPDQVKSGLALAMVAAWFRGDRLPNCGRKRRKGRER